MRSGSQASEVDRGELSKAKAMATVTQRTNFDGYLEEQLRDPAFAERFERAGEAWEVAMQIAALRRQAGLSQKELAALLETSQQQVSRLESPAYEGHSLSMLRRVARVLHARVRVLIEPEESSSPLRVAEATQTAYQMGKRKEAAGKRPPTKSKKFDCVELQHRGALRIYEETKNMTTSEQVAYWERKDEEFRRQRAEREALASAKTSRVAEVGVSYGSRRRSAPKRVGP
jgi:transcriptional regulator with XRE-family HTH domain